LESIGDYGCYNMISIHNWKLPDGLKTLGMSALGNDRMTQKASFYEMILPENLEYIGERALSRQARYYAYEGSLAAEFLRSEDMPFDEISFRLTEESISLKIGDEYQLEFVDAPMFLHRHVSYHSSNDKAVQVTADGHLRAYGAGEATITADNGTAQTSLKVTVKSDGNIETHLLRLPAGVISYAINLADFSGTSGQAIRSVVSDSEILKVGSDYSLEALDQGSCYLTVKTDNKTVRYLVQIYKPLSTVSPVLDDFVMLKGTGFRLRYNVYPLDSDDPNVLFESADPSVVSVTSDGYLVAEGPGETTISLTPRGGYGPTGHATVKVVTTEMDLPVWAIPLMYGKQFRLYFPDKGNLKFYSSDDSVATVDESGMIVSRGMGDCFIAVYNEEKTQATWVDVRMYRAFSNGIDVSEWQDTLTLNDWLAIKNYGIDFAILRAGHGTGWKDVQFENNYAKAREAGVQLGVYHYVEATTVEEAQNEAYMMMEWLDGKRFEYPVIIDIEDSDQRGLSPELFSEIIIAYGSILAHGGYKVAVYSYASLLDSKCTDEVLALYDVWQAHWGTLKPSVFEKPYTMWQYTSDGTVAGINGRCDMDICFF
ncbi:MAG: Ig-like domain-containing protein, partial [Erysipelotrichaceae bacterium]|nr:Ig-like domain-containing protein [Erysipelotrichaceae bacterium]